MTQTFCIGDFVFSLTCPSGLSLPENFLKFSVDEANPSYSYTLQLTDALPEPEGLTAAREVIGIRTEGNLESRWLLMQGKDRPYAFYRELDNSRADILFDRGFAEYLPVDPLFVSLLALERRLLGKDTLILHCAYVKHQEEAILFTAPSETGKTTQANLWGQYRGSETINGDRCLLQRRNGRWWARGWPVCGTSGVCRNQDTPIRAVVLLSQAKVDSVERLPGIKALSQLYSQITINNWNTAAMNRAMDDIMALIVEVPVLHLACTISEHAVDILEDALQTL